MADEKSKATLLKEEIFMKGKKGVAALSAEEVEKADDFCVGYKKFLDHSPVEREAVSYTLELAKKTKPSNSKAKSKFNSDKRLIPLSKPKNTDNEAKLLTKIISMICMLIVLSQPNK